MGKPTNHPDILVRAAPGGFRWNVLLGGETVGTDTAITEGEARSAAEAFARTVADEPAEGA
jgi:hypothetical protein